jgi:hypothetical protein
VNDKTPPPPVKVTGEVWTLVEEWMTETRHGRVYYDRKPWIVTLGKPWIVMWRRREGLWKMRRFAGPDAALTHSAVVRARMTGRPSRRVRQDPTPN